MILGWSELEEPVNGLDKVNTVDGLASLQKLVVAILGTCKVIAGRLSRHFNAFVSFQSRNSAKGPTVALSRSRD